MGQSFVAALAQNDFFRESEERNITILDIREPPNLENFTKKKKEKNEIPLHRTFTLSPSSIQFLEEIGVTERMNYERFCEYFHMQVWEKQGSSYLTFSSEDGNGMGRTVENDHLSAALYNQLKENVFYSSYFK